MGLFNRKKKNPVQDRTDAPVAESEPKKQGVSLPSGTDAASYQSIVQQHITEKSTALQAMRKYVFRVYAGAGKIEIRKAIEKLYKVSVTKVHIAYAPGKMRQVGRHQGKRPGFKKAIVTLKAGNSIDITG